MKSPALTFAVVAVFLLQTLTLSAQGGDHFLYGDLTVDETNVSGLKPLTFDLILYTDGGVLISRQTVSNNGRYRFNNLGAGFYDLVIEVESSEVARVRIDLSSPILKDVRKDISLEWRRSAASAKPGLLVVGDKFSRSPANQKLFQLAQTATEKRRYAEAATLLQRIVAADAKDFEAWVGLANVHFLQKNFVAAENEYLHALDARPGLFLALLNLGRLELSQKRYDVAIEALTKAVKVERDSPDANYFLGEAYLQAKKGSQAVLYFNAALRLDPRGMAEIHLRLALLYGHAGMRDKAAAEYEAFLKERPAYKDRKKLERYIAQNRKP
jgi:tetratricopeptide (TPR) repeat protein